MSTLLRRYIRESLRALLEGEEDDGLLVEPDGSPGEKADENTLGGGGIGGVTGPLGAGPTYPDNSKKKKRSKKKGDVATRSFGNGTYRD